MKNKFIRLLLAAILILNIVALSACTGMGDKADNETGDEAGNETGDEEKYSVTFQGTTLAEMQVEENYSLQRPSDPADVNNAKFFDWYTDESYTTPATFPMTIEKNTTLYAKYIPYKDYFLMARENTVGNDISGFEYNYDFQVSVTAPVVGTLTGIQSGTSKYSAATEVSYLDHHTNSGLLFNDGQIYEYKNGQTSNRIELNEDGKIVDFSSEITPDTQKYASSSFAKVLFTYSADDVKSITKNGNQYYFKTKPNASNVASTVLNLINHPIVEKILSVELPETESTASFYVTYDGGKISRYEYNFEVEVSAIKLQIKYTMNFQNKSNIPQIDLPTFQNFYISGTEVNHYLTTINHAIKDFKDLEVSSNTFKLKTAVDFGVSTNAINATYAGESKRSNDNGSVDYINLIEVDSDLKNKDLYNSAGLNDVKFVRGNTADGNVYDRVKKIIGYGDAVAADVSNRAGVDKYYLLLDDTFFNANNINSVSISTKNGTSVYSLTLTKNGAFALFDYVNKYATLNPFVDADIKVLGDYDKNDFSISDVDISIVMNNTTGSLVSVNVKVSGKSNVQYTGSRDFSVAARASVSMEWSFIVTNDIESYSAPQNAENLKF